MQILNYTREKSNVSSIFIHRLSFFKFNKHFPPLCSSRHYSKISEIPFSTAASQLFPPRDSLIYRTTGKLKLPNYETMMQSHMHFQPKDSLLHVNNVTFASYHDQPQLRSRKNLFRDIPKDKLMSTSSNCLASAFVQGMVLVN